MNTEKSITVITFLGIITLLLLAVCPQVNGSEWKPIIEYERANHGGVGLVFDEIPISNDEKMATALQKILDTRAFSRAYQPNVFDCSDMSQLVWCKLQQLGFDAKLAYGIRNNLAHVWVLVKKEGNYTVIECTQQKTLGTVVPRGVGTNGTGFNYKNEVWVFNSSHELASVFENDGPLDDLDPKGFVNYSEWTR